MYNNMSNCLVSPMLTHPVHRKNKHGYKHQIAHSLKWSFAKYL